MSNIVERTATTTACTILDTNVSFISKSVKQKSIKTYKKKTNLKTSLNNLEKIE